MARCLVPLPYTPPSRGYPRTPKSNSSRAQGTLHGSRLNANDHTEPSKRLSSKLRTLKTNCELSSTRFRPWLGLPVPTARPNTSTGAGSNMPAFLWKRRRIGVGLLRFTLKTGLGSWIIGATCWLLGRPVKLKRAYAVSTANFGGSSFVRVPCATLRERL